MRHELNQGFELGIAAIGTLSHWRHGVKAGFGVFEQAIPTAFLEPFVPIGAIVREWSLGIGSGMAHEARAAVLGRQFDVFGAQRFDGALLLDAHLRCGIGCGALLTA